MAIYRISFENQVGTVFFLKFKKNTVPSPSFVRAEINWENIFKTSGKMLKSRIYNIIKKVLKARYD